MHSLLGVERGWGQRRLQLSFAGSSCKSNHNFNQQSLAAFRYYRCDKLGRYSHPATRVFQALRIFVNNELNELNCAMEIANQFLSVDGLCVAITFHSLEDRIVKRHFHDIDLDEEMNLSLRQKMQQHRSVYSAEELNTIIRKKWEPLNKKVVIPTQEEMSENPRSRSAKLRAARKVK